MKELMIECKNIAEEIKPMCKTEKEKSLMLWFVAWELMEKYSDDIVDKMITLIVSLLSSNKKEEILNTLKK